MAEFFRDLNNLSKLKAETEKPKINKERNVYDAASKLDNEVLETYFDKYNELSDAKERNIEVKYDPNNLFLKSYNYSLWFENEESTDREGCADLSDMPPVEGDEEEVKEGKGL